MILIMSHEHVDAKKVYSYFSLSQLARSKCVFLTRFAPKGGAGQLELKLQSWVPLTSEVLKARLLILDTHGYTMFRSLPSISLPVIDGINIVDNSHILLLLISQDRNKTSAISTPFGRSGTNDEYHVYVCSDDARDVDGDMMTVRYHLSITGADDSEMDDTDAKLMWILAVVLVVYSLLLHRCIKKVMGYYDRNRHVSYPLIMVMSALACSWISVIFKLTEFLIEANTGHRLTYFDIFYDVTQISIDCLISVLMIIVLKFWLENPDSKCSKKYENMTIAFCCSIRYGWMFANLYSVRLDDQRFIPGSETGLLDCLFWMIHSAYILYLISSLVGHRRKTNRASHLWALTSCISFAYVTIRPAILSLLNNLNAEIAAYIVIHAFDIATSLFMMQILTDREQVFSVTSLDMANIGEISELRIGRDN